MHYCVIDVGNCYLKNVTCLGHVGFESGLEIYVQIVTGTTATPSWAVGSGPSQASSAIASDPKSSS